MAMQDLTPCFAKPATKAAVIGISHEPAPTWLTSATRVTASLVLSATFMHRSQAAKLATTMRTTTATTAHARPAGLGRVAAAREVDAESLRTVRKVNARSREE